MLGYFESQYVIRAYATPGVGDGRAYYVSAPDLARLGDVPQNAVAEFTRGTGSIIGLPQAFGVRLTGAVEPFIFSNGFATQVAPVL